MYLGREVDARDVATFCVEVLGLEDNINDIKEVHFYPRGIEVVVLARDDEGTYAFNEDPAVHILQFGMTGEWKPRGQQELLSSDE